MAIAAVNKDESVDEDIRHGALVYDAGLVWNPASGVKVYAKYGTLFRYPFTDEQAETSGYGADQFNADLRPETGFNAEAGAGLELGRRASFSGNVYYMMMDDEIALNSSFHNVNLDSTRRTGANLALTVQPLEGIKVSAGYAWVDAVFADGDNEGKRVPLVSEYGVDGSIEIGLPAGFSAAATLNYQGDAYPSGDNANVQDKIDAYQVIGVRARWETNSDDRRLALQAGVTNLLDASYAPLVFYGYSYPAEGRSVSVSVEYRY
jgi:outer membrane receptor protein involved in Fe transport